VIPEVAEAQRAWKECAAKLEAAIRAGSATESMLAGAGEILVRSRTAVAVYRARVLDDLTRVRSAQAYQDRPAIEPRIVRERF
jgi:hypothetical protein